MLVAGCPNEKAVIRVWIREGARFSETGNQTSRSATNLVDCLHEHLFFLGLSFRVRVIIDDRVVLAVVCWLLKGWPQNRRSTFFSERSQELGSTRRGLFTGLVRRLVVAMVNDLVSVSTGLLCKALVPAWMWVSND
jgi:hypothetical protein